MFLCWVPKYPWLLSLASSCRVSLQLSLPLGLWHDPVLVVTVQEVPWPPWSPLLVIQQWSTLTSLSVFCYWGCWCLSPYVGKHLQMQAVARTGTFPDVPATAHFHPAHGFSDPKRQMVPRQMSSCPLFLSGRNLACTYAPAFSAETESRHKPHKNSLTLISNFLHTVCMCCILSSVIWIY